MRYRDRQAIEAQQHQRIIMAANGLVNGFIPNLVTGLVTDIFWFMVDGISSILFPQPE